MKTLEQQNKQVQMIKDLLAYIPEKHLFEVVKVVKDSQEEVKKLENRLEVANAWILDTAKGILQDDKCSSYKAALHEINECIDGFYDEGTPRRLYPELTKFAGYINVISKVCHDSLKDS